MADTVIKTISQMREVAQKVKNETEVGCNTADRVGGLFEDIVNHIGHHEDSLLVLGESEYNSINKDESKIYFVYEEE
jgi:hypothetical protein